MLPDNEAWWRWAWSQGMREVLEALPPDALEEFREAAFARLDAMAQADGLDLGQRARFVVAARPSEA